MPLSLTLPCNCINHNVIQRNAAACQKKEKTTKPQRNNYKMTNERTTKEKPNQTEIQHTNKAATNKNKIKTKINLRFLIEGYNRFNTDLICDLVTILILMLIIWSRALCRLVPHALKIKNTSIKYGFVYLRGVGSECFSVFHSIPYK